MRAPAFWYAPPGRLATLLTPLSWLWRVAAVLRLRVPVKVRVPVLCVGNLVAGGAGKTPVVQDLVARLGARGVTAASLSRGHGGRLRGPLPVDPARHHAGDVGDEPLLLAATGAAWIGRDRVVAANAMVETGVRAIILDDGFQNHALHKDLSLIVVDGGTGFGNGRVIPAGPLRETVSNGLRRADALVVIGDGPGVATVPPLAGALPVLTARLLPDAASVAGLQGRPLLAFAGIGRPGKFFETLRDAGLSVVAEMAFPDHHPFSAADLSALLARAEALGATLVTTEKDAMRLSPIWRSRVAVLPVCVSWDDPAIVERLLDRVMGVRHG
ncbi:tetraacyldisaccharide 4'-kinase [Niveispirillum lacus]|uniref:Tetraacyldisaccharide 4'-kinase n=1 Tax=Niveispirillum lacus TaxID=1981099 RepID=A0A255YTM8_9PROT|nr:tetraacyldisaccharide 4'-kinase [Niveispirillum lacus]OYQ32587.1 tetraacyldisaccharide 4'-kinase [Niveispirillum lacus]